MVYRLTYIIAWVSWGLIALNPGGLLPMPNVENSAEASISLKEIPAFVIYLLGGACAPSIALFILMKKWGKTKDERAFFRTVFRADYGWKRALCFTAVFLAVWFIIAAFLGKAYQPLYMLIAFFPLMLIGGGLEEIGWRAFLQPALESKLSYLLTTFIIGLIWAVWHLPLFFLEGASQAGMNFPFYIANVVLLSFTITAIRRLSDSVVACIVWHAWYNTIPSVFDVQEVMYNPNALYLCVMAGIAIISTMAVYILKCVKAEEKTNGK